MTMTSRALSCGCETAPAIGRRPRGLGSLARVWEKEKQGERRLCRRDVCSSREERGERREELSGGRCLRLASVMMERAEAKADVRTSGRQDARTPGPQPRGRTAVAYARFHHHPPWNAAACGLRPAGSRCPTMTAPRRVSLPSADGRCLPALLYFTSTSPASRPANSLVANLQSQLT
ncbi:hypothetical protein BS50DRAFT_18390 [Corynespora cassiicola Philippines]|uniref:Uncharacterized protein n=1 Tax=Corynespora cassiicola Philippines TaxID=1448308 RepID=A0A2T2PAH1_CORCC|nr:hypothetical protein BS50DRAFT_18390 [Corynespora cassiicola Philippines]